MIYSLIIVIRYIYEKRYKMDIVYNATIAMLIYGFMSNKRSIYYCMAYLVSCCF